MDVLSADSKLVEKGFCLMREVCEHLKPEHPGKPFKRMEGPEQGIHVVEIASPRLVLTLNGEQDTVRDLQDVLCLGKKLFYGPFCFHRYGLLRTVVTFCLSARSARWT